ncbi:hypothetical protein [Romboutsia ilealis]|uniref:hypothetical protein n=2 Tax=Romboutsia ilealis TaxID=1115758 RepID=UPI00256FBC3D|nr:hypothetical protein [Romboutsia ilealis]
MKEKLTGYLKMIGLDQSDLAKLLEIQQNTLSFKINSKREFKRSEMIAITKLIQKKIPNVTMDEIFFE